MSLKDSISELERQNSELKQQLQEVESITAKKFKNPLDFQHRLKWYIMGKHSGAIFTEKRNTRDSNESCLLNILEEQSNSIPTDGTSDSNELKLNRSF